MVRGFRFAACILLVGASSGFAQDAPTDATPDVEVAPKTNGVFHGNYCGVGDNGPGLPPTDALDEACMHHDACTPKGQLPTCDCNARFKEETHAVAVGATQPGDLKAMAAMVEASIPVIPCR